jgi:urease accessory protein
MKSVHQDMMTLQTWFSPAFPTGAFSYSHGMESAIQNNLVKDAGSLKSWIDSLLSYGSGRNDGLFLKAAYEGFAEANDLCLASCGSKERLLETMELGQAFSRVVRASYDVNLPDGMAYPVAVGVTAKQIDLDLALTLQSYLQAFASNLISVGIRTIPIGQQAGQDCLIGLYPVIEHMTKKIRSESLNELGAATFVSDLMAMKHENSVPRIYRT